MALMIGGKLTGHNDPDHQQRVCQSHELRANDAIYSTALDITDIANQLAAERNPVDAERPGHGHALHHPHHPPPGHLMLNLTPPDTVATTRLDRQPRVLFASRV